MAIDEKKLAEWESDPGHGPFRTRQVKELVAEVRRLRGEAPVPESAALRYTVVRRDVADHGHGGTTEDVILQTADLEEAFRRRDEALAKGWCTCWVAVTRPHQS